MKKTFALSLVLILLVAMLAACGGSKANDQYVGLWIAETGVMWNEDIDVREFFNDGFTFDLQSGGKCTANMDGDVANGKWTLKDGVFTAKAGDFSFEGRMQDNILTVYDVMGMALTLRLYRQGTYTPPPPPVVAVPEPEPEQEPETEPEDKFEKIVSKEGYYVLDTLGGPDFGGQTVNADFYYEMLAQMGMDREEALTYVLIHEDGSVQLVAAGMLMEGAWSDGVFTFRDGDDTSIFNYTIEGDKLTATQEGGNVMTFLRSDETPPPLPAGLGLFDDEYFFEEEDEVTEMGMNDSLAWWEGEWYGYWTVKSARGDYEELADGIWDCYAVISVEPDGMGTVAIWDDDMEIGTVEINISVMPGSGSAGAAFSEDGYVFNEPIGYAAWFIIPDNAEYRDSIVIDATFEVNAEDYYEWSAIEYRIVLRPWGTIWDDVPAGERPPGYEGWYIDNDYSNYAGMLDALRETTINGEQVFIHPAVS